MLPHWRPQIVEVPITVTTSAYTAEDVIGGTLTSGTLTQYAGGGYIAWVRLVDDDDEKAALRLYVYREAPSTIADAAAFAPTEADWLKTLGCIELATANYDASGADACIVAAGIDRKTDREIIFDSLPAGKLFFRLVCDATPTYADANDLTLHICVLTM